MIRLSVIVASGLLAGTASVRAQSPATVAGAAPVASRVVAESGHPIDTKALLPEVASLPRGNPTLVGGTVSRLDRVRDQFVVQVFGGRRMRIILDGRTEIFRDGAKTSARDLKDGERVYVDTLLDGTNIFARSIRIVSLGLGGESRGQVLRYDPARREFTVRDALSPEPVRLRMTAATVFLRDNQAVSSAQLATGDLVAVKFRETGGEAVANEVSILATAGSAYVFAGRVQFLDVHKGFLVVVDPRDQKSYEINFNQARINVSADLREGSDVTVTAAFDGARYKATSIVVTQPASN